VSGKRRSELLASTSGERTFHVFANRGDSADQDMSFVLQTNQPGSRSEEDAHDLEQWFFVNKGSARFTVDGEESVVGPGDLVFVPRNALHWHEPEGEEAVELLVVNHWPLDSADQMGWDYAEDEPSVKSAPAAVG
jgi:quercetin dioxygenase-like cupin family protein